MNVFFFLLLSLSTFSFSNILFDIAFLLDFLTFLFLQTFLYNFLHVALRSFLSWMKDSTTQHIPYDISAKYLLTRKHTSISLQIPWSIIPSQYFFKWFIPFVHLNSKGYSTIFWLNHRKLQNVLNV